jgi:glycosyltransferase involved in cell wall biosynthesis
VLFVGRVTPNKRHEDLIRLASCWRRFVDPDLRLLLVGKLPRRATGRGETLPRHYFDALQSLMYEEGFTPEQVVFAGHVPHAELLAYYASAHVFVSMSEHEGFGVPLVEAMLMDVPVLAHAATAVPFTLGGAGVQFGEKRFEALAELAFALAHDAELRASVLAGQRRRLAAFAPATVEAALDAHLTDLGVSP